jgi:hypothetical protein
LAKVHIFWCQDFVVGDICSVNIMTMNKRKAHSKKAVVFQCPILIEGVSDGVSIRKFTKY